MPGHRVHRVGRAAVRAKRARGSCEQRQTRHGGKRACPCMMAPAYLPPESRRLTPPGVTLFSGQCVGSVTACGRRLRTPRYCGGCHSRPSRHDHNVHACAIGTGGDSVAETRALVALFGRRPFGARHVSIPSTGGRRGRSGGGPLGVVRRRARPAPRHRCTVGVTAPSGRDRGRPDHRPARWLR